MMILSLVLLNKIANHKTYGFQFTNLALLQSSKNNPVPWHHAKRRLAPLSMAIPLDDNFVVAFGWKLPLLEDSDLVFPSVVQSLFTGSFSAAQEIASDPRVAAEIYSDAAHLVMDFAGVLAPATGLVRLAAVIGRILTIASDYVPDHSMFPEEFLFQVCMLFLSATLLTKSLLPLVLSSSKNLSFQDRRTYCALFGPAGVNWHQYKTLATMALEWNTMDPHDTIDSNSTSIYWLYSGEVDVLNSNGRLVQTVSRVKQGLNPANAARCLLGEAIFIQRLETTKHKRYETVSPISTTTLKAGLSGAKLLRIDTNKLTFLMEHDEHLAKAIRRLLVKSMHDKLCSLFSG
jgi:hypothetical protein